MEAETSAKVNHPCDLCGSIISRPIKAALPYIGEEDPPVICWDCGFVYVIQRRSSEEIARAWDDIWGEGYSSKWPAVVARQHYVAEWCDQMFGWADKFVLDVGAGEGHFLDILRADYGVPRQWARGIDPDPKHCVDVGSWIAEATIESFDTANLFNVITILWTLENCGDCIGMLKKAKSLLKPGGMVVVATGSRILVPFKKPLGSYFSDNPADTHCFRFSANTLRAAFSIAGLPDTQTNQFLDSDWLVCAGRAGEGPVTALPKPYDHPAMVEDFFEDWRRLWP